MTLIEILCVIGLLSIAAAFSTDAAIGSLVRAQAGSDAFIAGSALRSVRAFAMQHACPPEECAPSEVSISTRSLIVRKGGTDSAFPLTQSSALQEVSFSPSGRPSKELTLLFGGWAVQAVTDGDIKVDPGN